MGGMGPGMGGSQGAGTMGASLGAMMGGAKPRGEFGFSQAGTAGRWMDVTLYASRNPSLAEALQNVPDATHVALTLKLLAPEQPKPRPKEKGEDEPEEWNYEPPKGKLIMYWGCSETGRLHRQLRSRRKGNSTRSTRSST
jgi:hypothetical protein